MCPTQIQYLIGSNLVENTHVLPSPHRRVISYAAAVILSHFLFIRSMAVF